MRTMFLFVKVATKKEKPDGDRLILDQKAISYGDSGPEGMG